MAVAVCFPALGTGQTSLLCRDWLDSVAFFLCRATDLNLLIDKQFLGILPVSLVQTRVMERDTKR